MYDYITPQKLLGALKANNPLYIDIDINEEWLEAAMANDTELCECLVEQENDGDVQMQSDCPIIDPQNSVANVVSHNVPNESVVDIESDMECSDNEDVLSTAVHKLETIASQIGFTIMVTVCSVLLHIS